MTMRDRLSAEADGLATAGLRLPMSFVLVLLPIIAYAWLGHAQATITSWQGEVGETGTIDVVGQLVEVRLLPSVWVLLLLIAIAVAGNIAARGRSDGAESARFRIASAVTMWVVVGIAIFGGWAWIALAASFGTDIGIPFPLMGTLSPLV